MKSAAKHGRSAWNELFTGTSRPAKWLRGFLTVGIAVVLVSCAASNKEVSTDTNTDETGAPPTTPAPTLANSNWKVIEVGGVAVADGSQPTLAFDNAGQLSGETPCNRYSATVMLSGNTMTISPMTSERIACTDTTRLGEERDFLVDMQGVKSYELDGDAQLRLIDANGQTVIRLQRQP